MENALISVIVPVYKVEKYLPNCISSIINQSYTNWELILVNDGSPDSCPEICDEFAAKDDRVRVIHQQNQGASAARNVALDNSLGIYVSFVDGDDYLHKDYLRNLLELAISNSADIVQCSYIRGSDVVFPKVEDKQTIKILNNHSVFIEGYAKIMLWGKLYSRKVIGDVRMPVGKYFEDDFTTWKWYYRASIIVLTSKKLYYYMANFQSSTVHHNIKPKFDFLEAYDERISFFQSTGDQDLEEHSRGHICRAMVIARGNPNLSEEQKKLVMETFSKNWKLIKNSVYLPKKLKFIFMVFGMFPFLVGRLVFNINKG